jgi:Protein of unknown function (DUF3126)
MKEDVAKLQRYLRKLFKSDAIRVVMHAKKADLAELYMGDEFLAPIYREVDDGEVSYQVQMAILSEDLTDA